MCLSDVRNSRKFMRAAVSLFVAAVMLIVMSLPAFAYSDTVNVSDYLEPDTGADAADIIQSVIDSNPNRTIEFPDGEYLVSKPILTPADPEKSVSLKMTDYTVIKAIGDWQSGEAVIQLGGKDPANTTHYSGSNYSLEAGVIDGNGIADGVSINSGRETQIRNTSIKNAVTGLHIMYGANNGSSDADITNVNIIGTGRTDSVGVLVEGYDNTFTDMRIGYVFTGVVLKSAGNSLRNIHPLYYSDATDYENSCGFVIEKGNNWLDFCYSDQFATGFLIKNGASCILNDCFCMWYTDMGDKTAIKAEDGFNATVTNFTANLWGGDCDTVLKTDKMNGDGVFSALNASGTRDNDFVYKGFIESSNVIEKIIHMFYRMLGMLSLINC